MDAATRARAISRVGRMVLGAQRELKGAMEILSRAYLSAGEEKGFVERAVRGAEIIADAATAIAEVEAQLTDEAGGMSAAFSGLARAWVNQGIALVSKMADEAELKGIDTAAIRMRLRKLAKSEPPRRGIRKV